MSDLEKMQALFHGAVIGQKTDFLSCIEKGGKISPERRLGIYQHAYRARLRDILQEDYPVLHTMLGDEAFYTLCQLYIDLYPSGHPSLRLFGRYLEKLVGEEPPYCDNPVVQEMAHFEWKFHDVFDAPDAPYVTLSDVAALSPMVWTTLRFRFHPSFYMQAYEWNVAGVWASVKEQYEEPTLPEKMPEPADVIQWRYDLRSYFRTLPREEAAALKVVSEYRAFPEVCEALAKFYGDDAPAKAANFLKGWVVEGLISRLDHAKLPL
ncbi:DNA-binding domain-containing protein [Paremcibacter congregatus]|nr:DNA-binding domain-containing protein [Paremcibacter congregatus]